MSRHEARKWIAATCILGAAIAAAGSSPSPQPAAAPAPDEVAARGLRERAQQLVERGEVGEAIDLATVAANLAPDDPESWLLLSAVHSAAGHRQRAASSYRR
jgi:Flp pilus assembly protein TadD